MGDGLGAGLDSEGARVYLHLVYMGFPKVTPSTIPFCTDGFGKQCSLLKLQPQH